MIKFSIKIMPVMFLLFTMISVMVCTVSSENLQSASKITETLTSVMLTSTQETERIPVRIRLKDDMAEELCQETILSLLKQSKTLSTTTILDIDGLSAQDVNEYISVKRQATASVFSKINCAFSTQHLNDDDIIYSCKYVPIIIAELTVSDINALKYNDKISSIDYYSYLVGKHDIVDQSIELSQGQVRSNNQYNTVTQVPTARQTFNVSGSGVTIGILDVGNLNINHGNITYMDVECRYSTEDVPINNHPTTVAAILYSIAPDAQYYYTTHMKVVDNEEYLISNTTIENEIEWLIDNGSNIINMSMALYEEYGDNHNTYGVFSQLLDEISNNTNVTFVKSAGNDGAAGITSGGMANNIITVGNYDDKMTTTYDDDEIEDSSSYYACQGIDDDICLYKPDICAPASHITLGYADNGCGTSYAAPQISGIAALMMQKDASLKAAPEDVKAILTASVNMETPHHYKPVGTSLQNYKMYGAGLVNAYNALTVTSNEQFYSSYLSTSTSEKTHTINITSDMIGKTLRISLAYLKHHSHNLPNVNLSLESSSGMSVNRSESLANNVEIMEYVPTSAGVYTIIVEKFGIYSNSNIYYCVAWDCTD